MQPVVIPLDLAPPHSGKHPLQHRVLVPNWCQVAKGLPGVCLSTPPKNCQKNRRNKKPPSSAESGTPEHIARRAAEIAAVPRVPGRKKVQGRECGEANQGAVAD